MPSEASEGQNGDPRRGLETSHAQALHAGLANLLIAANAWRAMRGLTPLPHFATAAAERADRDRVRPARVPPKSLPQLLVRPQRKDRTDAEREAETIARGQAEAAAILARYHSQFGSIYNADNMSELLDVHAETERWRHHDAVRSTASALTQAAFDWAMAHPLNEADATALFSAGGNGSGKSTFMGTGTGGVGLDSTLSDYQSSARNIDTALRSGRAVAMTFIYRAPLDAFLHGVVPRVLDPRNGRPVTIVTHARTHTRAPDAFLALADHYRDEPRVSACVIENHSGTLGVVRSLDWLRQQADMQIDALTLRRQLLEILENDVPPAHRHRFA